ncbi:helix-turn-helix domain-containing protein [Solilutibacter silvestris]|uniref:helix-turn-helix domain-containing protein n=1 Tax=Solilutibacter silvestris TaxID=1645665 RepID=UPI003D339C72
MDIATRIRIARRKIGFSQKAMAASLGIGRSAITNWENLDARPSTSNLQKLAALTGISFEWLATGRGPMVVESLFEPVAGAEGLIPHTPSEVRLLSVFRVASEIDKLRIMEVIDSIADLLG